MGYLTSRQHLRRILVGVLAATTIGAGAVPTWANVGVDASTASVLSGLAVGAVVGGLTLLLSNGVQLVLVSTEVIGERMAWVLERASDHARTTLAWSGSVAGGASIAAGTTVAVVGLGSGLMLATSSLAIGFIPNSIGASLLSHEELAK